MQAWKAFSKHSYTICPYSFFVHKISINVIIITMKKTKLIIITIISALILSACSSTPVAGEIGTEPAALKPAAGESPTGSADYDGSAANVREDDGRTVVGISMPDRLLERWNHDGTFLKEHFKTVLMIHQQGPLLRNLSLPLTNTSRSLIIAAAQAGIII